MGSLFVDGAPCLSYGGGDGGRAQGLRHLHQVGQRGCNLAHAVVGEEGSEGVEGGEEHQGGEGVAAGGAHHKTVLTERNGD